MTWLNDLAKKVHVSPVATWLNDLANDLAKIENDLAKKVHVSPVATWLNYFIE